MKRTRWLLLFALLLLLVAVIYTQNHRPTEHSMPSCDTSLQHVYHPSRLQILSPACLTVTGTIAAIRREPDGDDHIRLRLDSPFQKYLNAGNRSHQHGDLVLEPICLHLVTQGSASGACTGYKGDVIVPRVGSRITVTGTYVFDAQHGWNEIHPVTSMAES